MNSSQKRGWHVGAALLVLAVGAARLEANDAEAEGDERNALEIRLERLIRTSEVIVWGRVTQHPSSATERTGTPGRVFRMEAASWLRPEAGTSTLDVFIEGGIRSDGRRCDVSHPMITLQPGVDYLAFGAFVGPSTALVQPHTVFRVDREKNAVYDESGHQLLIVDGRLTRSPSVVVESSLRFGRSCPVPGAPSNAIFTSDDGLGYQATEMPSYDTSADAVSFESLVSAVQEGGTPQNLAGTTKLVVPNCGPCRPRTTDARGLWRARPFVFDIRFDTIKARNRLLPSVHRALRAWNLAGRHRSGRPILGLGTISVGTGTGHSAYWPDGRSAIVVTDIKTPASSKARRLGGAKGKTFIESNVATRRISEIDILVKQEVATRAHLFRQTFEHELGHAFTLGHSCGFSSLMVGPTETHVPRQYGETSQVRRGDLMCARDMLRRFNARARWCAWRVQGAADLATEARFHPKPGSECMTKLSWLEVEPEINKIKLAPGTYWLHGIHLENLGSVAVEDLTVTFRLVSAKASSNTRHQIGQFRTSSLATWLVGSFQVRIPDEPGRYYLEWIVSTSSWDADTHNNRAFLMRSRLFRMLIEIPGA